MDAGQARRVAETYVADNMKGQGTSSGYVIYEDPEEDGEGWYFYYQTAKYVKTGDIQDSIVGNWPIFVDRQGFCHGARIPPSISSNNENAEIR